MSDDEALAALARTPRLLVALDFDGTLSPLVDEPMAARMLPAARDAVAALVAAPDTTVALVSGRSLPDLRVIAEHDDDSPILLVGSHGAEHWVPGAGELPRTDDAAALALRDRLRAEAEDLVADIPGAWIEPKTFGFAVPTRTVAPSERASSGAASRARPNNSFAATSGASGLTIGGSGLGLSVPLSCAPARPGAASRRSKARRRRMGGSWLD